MCTWCISVTNRLTLSCPREQAGHEALSQYPWVNAVIGIVLHTFVLTPFYAWRATHRIHHVYRYLPYSILSGSHYWPQKSTNNLERDVTYIPPTRNDFKLPDGKVAVRMDYAEVFEETPAYTLFKLFVRQFL